MNTRVPVTARIGMALLVLVLPALFGIRHWYATRTFDPVDIPISLRRGHIRTGPFKINLKRWYFVRFHQGYLPAYDPNCPDSQLNAHWMLYRNGQVVADIDEQTTYYYEDGFNAEPGIYDLDAEILSDESCHDPGHPRLIIYTDDSGYQDYKILFTWLVPLSIAVGIGLLLLSYAAYFARDISSTVEPVLFENRSQNFQWAQKLPLRSPFSTLPSFGAVGAITVLLVLVPMWVITASRPTRVGVKVYLVKPNDWVGKIDIWSEPLVVRLEEVGNVTPVFLNSKKVSWESFADLMKTELSRRRPHCPVYVQADDNVGWESVARIIATINGLNGRAILLPRTAVVIPGK